MKTLSKPFYVLVVCALLLASLGPVAAPTYAAVPASLDATTTAPALLQFQSGGHVLGFTPTGIYAATGSHALRVEFVDALPVQPQSDTPPSQSGQAAPLGQVTYANLWRGVTLTYDAPGGSILRSAYQVAPGANPADIRLRYNVPVRLDEAGNLRIAFETGEMTESAPSAWQEMDGQRTAVQIAFRLVDSAIRNPQSAIPWWAFPLTPTTRRARCTLPPPCRRARRLAIAPIRIPMATTPRIQPWLHQRV